MVDYGSDWFPEWRARLLTVVQRNWKTSSSRALTASHRALSSSSKDKLLVSLEFLKGFGGL